MRKNKGIIGILFAGLLGLVVMTYVKAEDPNVTPVASDDCDMEIIEHLAQGASDREVMININNVKSGKRLSNFQYCLNTSNCDDEDNWIDIDTYNQNERVTAFQIGAGTNDMTFSFEVPMDKLKIKAVFEDFEPMDITYSKFKLTTNDPHEYGDVYDRDSHDLANYEETYNDLIIGYKGGDIVLPGDCTNNGCILKFTLSTTDYNAIVDRLTDFNENVNQDMDSYQLLDLSAMYNHLDIEGYSADTIYPYTVNNELYIENGENTKSFYLIINKFFTENNRSEFAFGDNKNRILAEDYIGVKYIVDRKYFDEADGFLSFTEGNNYTQNATLFYGAPRVQLVAETARPLALTNEGNSDGAGTLNYQYNKIVSKNNTKYPIDENFELTINSFYEQEYVVPLVLKNNDTTVKEVTLSLSRFAFGGNAGNLLIVDSEGNNCRDPRVNQNCHEGNYYISTSYRGLVDTFYTDGTTETINTFGISSQLDGLRVDERNNNTVYKRNEDFNPWAVAIFYHDDMVVATRSYNLGELVKTEGITTDPIENSVVNGHARNYNNELINDYDSSNYTYFSYGLGFEKPIGSIRYFEEQDYRNGKIDYPLVLASKEEIIDNDVNRIALFLTNGELKSDEANFPELTYGVGEGKIFEVDNRTFDRLGGNN